MKKLRIHANKEGKGCDGHFFATTWSFTKRGRSINGARCDKCGKSIVGDQLKDYAVFEEGGAR